MNDVVSESMTAESEAVVTPAPGTAPLFKAKHRTMNAGCWGREVAKKENGELFTAYSISLSRSYLDGRSGKWKQTQALHINGERDLINLSIVVNEMLGLIRDHRKQTSKSAE